MTAPPPPAANRLRVLVPVTGAFHGRLRLRRSSGTLDTEGLERVLSRESAQAIALALQLKEAGAELVAVHVDKGAGEEVLREALAHGVDQGILVEGAPQERSDASLRAATIAEIYRTQGPFDAVVGPARSEFSGFTGALAAAAGRLEVPCVVGVHRIEAITDTKGSDGFRIAYQSLFGDYDLRIPRPCVVLAGDLPPSHPSAWGIHDAWRVRGILRVPVDPGEAAKPLTQRVRVEPVPRDEHVLETLDAPTLVRRMRSRGLVGERRGG